MPAPGTYGSDARRERPDLGPTFPALLRARFGVPAKATAAGVVALALLALVLALVRPGVERKAQLVHRDAPTFNLLYSRSAVHRAAARRGELARLEGRARSVDTSVVVAPLVLPPYRGNVSFGLLPLYATRYEERLRRELPAFGIRDEGRARVNDAPGYQLGFRGGSATRPIFGRQVLVLPSEQARAGVVLTLRIDVTGPLGASGRRTIAAVRKAFRSFRFGTDRG